MIISFQCSTSAGTLCLLLNEITKIVHAMWQWYKSSTMGDGRDEGRAAEKCAYNNKIGIQAEYSSDGARNLFSRTEKTRM